MPRDEADSEIDGFGGRGGGGFVPMKLLVLGGTRFLGRAVVDVALARGWDVTALHRGVTGTLPDTVAALLADRSLEQGLVTALDGME